MTVRRTYLLSITTLACSNISPDSWFWSLGQFCRKLKKFGPQNPKMTPTLVSPAFSSPVNQSASMLVNLMNFVGYINQLVTGQNC